MRHGAGTTGSYSICCITLRTSLGYLSPQIQEGSEEKERQPHSQCAQGYACSDLKFEFLLIRMQNNTSADRCLTYEELQRAEASYGIDLLVSEVEVDADELEAVNSPASASAERRSRSNREPK
jgi:hypothetical protein